tara:strand:+ start:1714 stop:1911 length:198 start_codon:yes stop_codon:yes gene_type:complete
LSLGLSQSPWASSGIQGKEIFISSTSSSSKFITSAFSVEYSAYGALTPYKGRDLLSTGGWGIQGA